MEASTTTRTPLVEEYTAEDVERIARVCHEANRAFCASIGDLSQPDWLHAPDWQKESARLGVRGILDGAIREPKDSHESWMRQKAAEGWTYGPVKDPELKQHPCMVAYHELPEQQRRKDYLFMSIVFGLSTPMEE